MRSSTTWQQHSIAGLVQGLLSVSICLSGLAGGRSAPPPTGQCRRKILTGIFIELLCLMCYISLRVWCISFILRFCDIVPQNQPLHSNSLCFRFALFLLKMYACARDSSLTLKFKVLLFAGKTSAFRFLLLPYFCVTTLWKTTKQPPEQIWEARCSVDHWNYPCHLADVFALIIDFRRSQASAPTRW